MAYCPSCRIEIAVDSITCPNCQADFGEYSAWKPTLLPEPESPSVSTRGAEALALLGGIITIIPLVSVVVGLVLRTIIPDCEVSYGSRRICTVAGIDLAPLIGSMIVAGGPLLWFMTTLIGIFFGFLAGIAAISQACISTSTSNTPAKSRKLPDDDSPDNAKVVLK